ncbi:MAG: tRNA-binding protein [Planctomycetota bacterium]|nr:tRNA-binding protein [Planctomycetota bacterium]
MDPAIKALVSITDLERLDLRVGKIVQVDEFPEAKKPAWLLSVDLGPIGIKRSSAQVTHYTREELEGRSVVCLCNLPPRQVGPHLSEVLVLGGVEPDGIVRLLLTAPDCPPGTPIA